MLKTSQLQEEKYFQRYIWQHRKRKIQFKKAFLILSIREEQNISNTKLITSSLKAHFLQYFCF